MTTAKARAPRADAPAGTRKVVRIMSGRGLGLFSETIVVSLAVGILSIPAVTAVPAFAAGSAHLRRHVEGESDSLSRLGRDFVRALARGWLWGVGAAAGFAAVLVTLTSPMISRMPGGEAYRWFSAIAAAAAAVVLLRATATWTPDARWGDMVREAAEESARDAAGSLLIVLALALSGVIVWMFAPLVVLVPGLLVLATRAVVARRDARRRM